MTESTTSDTSRPGCPEPPFLGGELDTLVGSLERQRATFAWKCEGLDQQGLSLRIATSDLTLGRLLKHLAYMEDLNFTGELAGAPLPEPWSRQDVSERSAWVFISADVDSPTDLYRWWRQAVDRSRAAVRSAVAAASVEACYVSNGSEVGLRRLLVDMIEEYGRHTGHADLLREAVDGRVGEDPPGSPFAFTLTRGGRRGAATTWTTQR